MRTRAIWLAAAAGTCLVLVGAAQIDLPTPTSPLPLFWFGLIITGLCALAAIATVVIGARVGQPQLAILGAGLYAASLFPFVHVLVLPGVIWHSETNLLSLGAWMGSVAGLAIAWPALSRTTGLGRAILARSTRYAIGSMAATSVLAALLVWQPDLLPAAKSDSWWALGGSTLACVGWLALAFRQVELFEVGRRWASVAAAAGLTWLGASAVFFLLPGASDTGVWAVHIIDGFGVLGAATGLTISHADNRNLTAVFAPVLNRDPAVALRLGVTPQVGQLVAMLDDKDANTSGHVTRVAELTMRLAERAGIGGTRLRNIGLAALLHDIGKLKVPTEILTKPGSLTNEEFELIRQHPVWGEEILRTDPLLADVATLVRSHHERVDGRGYPDGLVGDEVTLDMALVSVCDSWDAMVQTRHYREGMTTDRARSIFFEHAGTQWPTEAVLLLFDYLDSDPSLDGLFGDLIAPEHHVCAEALDGLIA